MRRGLVVLVVALLAVALVVALIGVLGLVSLRAGDGRDASAPVEAGAPAPDPVGPPEVRWEEALGAPREDSYYPEVGDPGVDSLHHDLSLTWDPDARILDGADTLTFRATRDARQFQLDLGAPLTVSSVELDGARVRHREQDKDLVVAAPVVAGQVYRAEIRYSGTPEPVPAPTERTDVDTTGWTTTSNGEAWTMQQPFGAFTWYPVNDHPSDEAYYDVAITAPSPLVGVSNGALESREESDGATTTRWHVDEPVASYLMTIAVGEYDVTEDQSASGVPVTYWTPRDDPGALADLRAAVPALAWLEERLGPYPFSTLGLVTVHSESAMETQTMVTLGDTAYARSPAVVLHELAHQWYGDQVTPSDWRDLWMNEGMAMYLQLLWQAEQAGTPADTYLAAFENTARIARAQGGPPGRYRPRMFGNGTVYYVPALMWHELRGRVGDETFWKLVRDWPQAQDNQNPTREEYLTWVEEQTGEELTEFFDAWLMRRGNPPDSP